MIWTISKHRQIFWVNEWLFVFKLLHVSQVLSLLIKSGISRKQICGGSGCDCGCGCCCCYFCCYCGGGGGGGGGGGDGGRDGGGGGVGEET